MFDFTSRYHDLETVVLVSADGVEVPYKRRRFLPSSAGLPLLGETTVVQNDRLDLVAERTLGVSEAFWRIADGNDAMNPLDLTRVPGRRLRVPQPQP